MTFTNAMWIQANVNIALTQVKSTYLLEGANNCVRLASHMLQAQIPKFGICPEG